MLRCRLLASRLLVRPLSAVPAAQATATAGCYNQLLAAAGWAGSRAGGDSSTTPGSAAAAAAALAAAAAAATQRADCAAGPGVAAAPDEAQSGWLSWAAGWLPWRWWGGAPPAAPSPYLEALQRDPHVGVVMAFALPLISLAFGFTPVQADMDEAARALAPHLEELRPWELSVLMWGGARLGYAPPPALLAQLQQQALDALRQPHGSPEAFSTQEACMAAWALAVLQGLTPDLWAAALSFLAACPEDSWDEVALIHLYQAAMFVPRSAVTAHVPGQAGRAGNAAMPPMRSAADEVRATLAAGGCPLPLVARAEQAYRAASRQAGFDGPLIVELSMLRTLVSIYKELGGAYAQDFEDLRLADLRHAEQLLADPYLLAKFKSEVADKRARTNNFTRTLTDVSRTLRDLGLHHTLQEPVEDGLVHVDVALPDYKIAFFLEPMPASTATSASSAANGRAWGGGGGLSGAVPAASLRHLDPEGAMLGGFVANETPGSRAAKLRLLQQRGWVVLPLAWIPNISGEGEKRRLLLQQLDKAGREQLMRGRVSAMLHGAMRTAEESKLGRGRYGAAESAGENITRGGRR